MNPRQTGNSSPSTRPTQARPPSPPIGQSKRRGRTPKLCVESESESDSDSASPLQACRLPARRGSSRSATSTATDSEEDTWQDSFMQPSWGLGRAFLDLEAESTSASETDDATEPSGDECSVDWFLETRPRAPRKRPRVNLRLAASTDRRTEVVCPASKRPRRQPPRDTSQTAVASPASSHQLPTRRSERLQRIRGRDDWALDLRALRHNINQLFRGLRSNSNSHGLANRLRRVVRDAYLMGYCRHRVAPDAWGHLLQVTGSRAFHLRNMIIKTEQRWEKAAAPLDLPPLATPKYGSQCDEGLSDTSEGSTSAATDSDTPDDQNPEAVCSHSNSRSQSGQANSQDTEEAWRCALDETQCSWSTPNSQPWLSMVLADTNSVDRSSSGSSKSSPAPLDSCRRMQFPNTCPYPCV
ncbi:regulatory protein ICP22 [Pteropodid alphaherpesvirus 1]|uniref:Regulatory protein ICP22 n=1 Tax=Pteropodid alphaherpesvirus 1 TaxID=1343901 RepID=A0A060Q0X5_9ALPH|nr:regulatory protein ICP22 [Pteropodid alphaherpesvirus 1]BAP00739.1 regulatory protein ICP22 [Pteropodid alphaherpesvirus 1]